MSEKTWGDIVIGPVTDEMERLRAENARLRALLEQAVPDYLPDTVVEATDVIRDCAQEFAIRLLRARDALRPDGEDK